MKKLTHKQKVAGLLDWWKNLDVGPWNATPAQPRITENTITGKWVLEWVDPPTGRVYYSVNANSEQELQNILNDATEQWRQTRPKEDQVNFVYPVWQNQRYKLTDPRYFQQIARRKSNEIMYDNDGVKRVSMDKKQNSTNKQAVKAYDKIDDEFFVYLQTYVGANFETLALVNACLAGESVHPTVRDYVARHQAEFFRGKNDMSNSYELVAKKKTAVNKDVVIQKYVIIKNKGTEKLSFEGVYFDFIEFAAQKGHFQELYVQKEGYSGLTGLLGPMFDGGFIRYEDASTYNLLSSSKKEATKEANMKYTSRQWNQFQGEKWYDGTVASITTRLDGVEKWLKTVETALKSTDDEVEMKLGHKLAQQIKSEIESLSKTSLALFDNDIEDYLDTLPALTVAKNYKQAVNDNGMHELGEDDGSWLYEQAQDIQKQASEYDWDMFTNVYAKEWTEDTTPELKNSEMMFRSAAIDFVEDKTMMILDVRKRALIIDKFVTNAEKARRASTTKKATKKKSMPNATQTYQNGWYDGVNGLSVRMPDNLEYMEGYDEGLSFGNGYIDTLGVAEAAKKKAEIKTANDSSELIENLCDSGYTEVEAVSVLAILMREEKNDIEAVARRVELLTNPDASEDFFQASKKKTAGAKKTAGKVPKAIQNMFLKAVEEVYRVKGQKEFMSDANSRIPTLLADISQYEGTSPGYPGISWEGGPFEWSIDFSNHLYNRPEFKTIDYFWEPINHYSGAIYPI